MAALMTVGFGCQNNIQPSSVQKKIVNVGYFANVNHAPALIGIANGSFQHALGNEMQIKTKIFNAGPSAMEAIFAGAIDIAYIGPMPAINGYLKSEGKALRIVSGSTYGGASLVLQQPLAREFLRIGSTALQGKTIATPQQGNTQDMALRHYVREQGLSDRITIRPMTNADQINAFRQNKIDGAWAPEPWATRLVTEAGGDRAMDERERWHNGRFPSAVIVVRQTFLHDRPEVVKAWLRAHVETIAWMNNHAQEAKATFNRELKKITSMPLPDPILDEAWKRLIFSIEPLRSQTEEQTQWAREEGFFTDDISTTKDAYDTALLEDVTPTTY